MKDILNTPYLELWRMSGSRLGFRVLHLLLGQVWSLDRPVDLRGPRETHDLQKIYETKNLCPFRFKKDLW